MLLNISCFFFFSHILFEFDNKHTGNSAKRFSVHPFKKKKTKQYWICVNISKAYHQQMYVNGIYM